VPSGATITGGLGTNSISVSYGETPILGAIGILESNGIGSTYVSLKISTGIPPITTSIQGPTTVDPHQNSIYSVSTSIGVLYNWSVTGGTIVSGQGTSTVTVDWGSSGGTLTLGETNNYGTTGQSLTVNPSNPTGILSNNEFVGLSVYPNPFKDGFTIRLNGQFTFTIFNIEGITLETGTEQSASIGQSLIRGTYILRIQNAEGVKFLKLVKE
jgi:hypothetical protein